MVITFIKENLDMIYTISIILIFVILMFYLIIKKHLKKYFHNKKLSNLMHQHNFVVEKHIFYRYIDYHDVYFDNKSNIIFSTLYFPFIRIQKANNAVLEFVNLKDINEIKCILNNEVIFNFNSENKLLDINLRTNQENYLSINIKSNHKEFKLLLINEFLLAKDDTKRLEQVKVINDFINKLYENINKMELIYY